MYNVFKTSLGSSETIHLFMQSRSCFPNILSITRKTCQNMTRIVNINLDVKKGCFGKLTNDLKDYHNISSYDIHNFTTDSFSSLYLDLALKQH